MKKTVKIFMIITLLLGMFLITSCDSESTTPYERALYNMEAAIERCTGSCLTREEMAQLVYNFEKVQEEYSGKPVEDSNDTLPELRMVTPREHEHDEKTRYEIRELLDNRTTVVGITVSVMDDTSACKIEQTEKQKGTHWELVDTYSETEDDVIKSDNSTHFMGSGTEFITQYDNDFDSSDHATMTFRCHMDELPSVLNPGDEIAINIVADIISDDEIITNASMNCNLIIPTFFNATSDTGANDSDDGIYAGGNTFTGLEYMSYMEDCVRFTVPEKNADSDQIMIVFYTKAGSTNWIYEWK